ncbi:MAG: glycine cleavage system protein GcvH [Candidatus Cloacimonadota bacterium]|nr:MAG: glycine cleavage system protein GcvH [Candidatus Cloacimonadota bacterium]
MVQKGLKYTETHEWVNIRGNIAIVGITDYAQKQLGDIVFVDLPEEGDEVTKGDSMASVEAVKAVADVNAPLNGIIVGVNEKLEDAPDLINSSPYDEAWIAKIKISDSNEIDDLMDAEEYEAFIGE